MLCTLGQLVGGAIQITVVIIIVINWLDFVLWIGFCLTGPITLCLHSFLCMYVYVQSEPLKIVAFYF